MVDNTLEAKRLSVGKAPANPQGFNEGGLAMERQMDRIMAEGGIKDDGMNKDPISGNDVPPGSLSKEVRDDVDAKLSEGEYVVPADVVRYFGVNYFEKLRAKAKAGLEEMDRDGRIGGDPVPMDDDFPFSDEELMSVEDETVEMAEGGVVSGFNPAAFQPGFSFGMASPAGQGLPSETKTFVNAQGEVLSILFINGQPIQQIPAGFVEDTPENRARFTQGEPTVAPTSTRSDGGDRPVAVQPPQSTSANSSGFSLSEEDSTALSDDPLAFGLGAIKNDELFSSRRLGGAGSLVAGAPGMVIGGIAGAGMELENVARARAALLIAKERNLTDSPQYAELESKLEKAESELSGAARLLDAAGFGSGENYAKSLLSAPQTTTAPTTPQAIPTGGSLRGSAGINTAKTMTPQQVQAGAQKASTGAAREENWDGGKVVTNQNKPSTKTTSQAKSAAQRAADKLGKPMATGGRAKGGLVERPKKKPVAKK